jgi:hypothetical protein
VRYEFLKALNKEITFFWNVRYEFLKALNKEITFFWSMKSESLTAVNRELCFLLEYEMSLHCGNYEDYLLLFGT